MVAGRLHPPAGVADVADRSAGRGEPATLDAVAAALTGIRGAKSGAKVSMRAELARVTITGPAAAP